MKTFSMLAGLAALGLAGAATAQTTAPAQGSPPYTNTPAPATTTPDPAPMTTAPAADTMGSATAPSTMPMADATTATPSSDSMAMDTSKAKKKGKKKSEAM